MLLKNIQVSIKHFPFHQNTFVGLNFFMAEEELDCDQRCGVSVSVNDGNGDGDAK